MTGDSLQRYRAQVAALGPAQQLGRRLAFWNMALVILALAVITVPLTINIAIDVAQGGTPLDPECLAEHWRRYCYTQASWDRGPVDLPGWALIPLALASALLIALVWPAKRHYYAVKPSRPIVIIVASPTWFGIFDLMLAAFTGVFTWSFASGWGPWAAEFVPAVVIWAATGVVGIVGELVVRARDRRRSVWRGAR